MGSAGIEFVEPEDGMFTTYANNIAYGFTPSDVRLLFGEVIDLKDNKGIVEQRAHVTLAWLHAKILHIMLGAIVAQHEKAMGEIKIPPEMLQFGPG